MNGEESSEGESVSLQPRRARTPREAIRRRDRGEGNAMRMRPGYMDRRCVRGQNSVSKFIYFHVFFGLVGRVVAAVGCGHGRLRMPCAPPAFVVVTHGSIIDD